MDRLKAHNEDFSAWKVFFLTPSIFFLCFVFLISRLYQGESCYEAFTDLAWKPDNYTMSDFYSYTKSKWVNICTIYTLIILAIRVCGQAIWEEQAAQKRRRKARKIREFAGALHIKKTKLYIPLGIYFLCVVLSYAFAEYKDIAWNGADGLFVGAAYLLGCALLFFYTFNSLEGEKGIKCLVYIFTFSIVVVSILGITQATGHDFFRTAIGQKILVPNVQVSESETAWALIDRLAASGETALEFRFTTQVYQTVANPNYVALYVPLILPLYISLFWRAKKWGFGKILYLVVFAIELFSLICSNSSGGYLGLAAFVVAGIVLSWRAIFRKVQGRRVYIHYAVLVAVFILAFGLANEQGNFTAVGEWENVKTTISDITGIGKDKVATEADTGADAAETEVTADDETAADETSETTEADEAATEEESPYANIKVNKVISAISTQKDAVYVTADGIGFSMTVEDGGIGAPESVLLKNTYGEEVDVPIVIQNGAAEDGNEYVSIQVGADEAWTFQKTDAGYRYINYLGKQVDLQSVKTAWSDEHGDFGSGRGYIWSRTIPLLFDSPKNFFIGHGPNTLTMYFPHTDYVGRVYNGWDRSTLITKPHNMFLDYAFGSGVVSLIAWLAFIVMYLIWSWKLYYRKKDTLLPASEGQATNADSFAAAVGRGIAIGIPGFLLSGMFYDCTASIMPIFWGLMAVGVTCNYFVQREKFGVEETEEEAPAAIEEKIAVAAEEEKAEKQAKPQKSAKKGKKSRLQKKRK